MLGLEHAGALQHRYRLLQCARKRAHPPQATKHPGQENLPALVAVVEHLYRFFKSAHTFAEAALNGIKPNKRMLPLFDSFDSGMLNRPRPGSANVIKFGLDLQSDFALPGTI